MTRLLNEEMHIANFSVGREKLPEIQCTEDKLRLIEKKKTNIQNMKNLLHDELKNNSKYSEKAIKDIDETINSDIREDIDRVLKILLSSKKVSKRCNRIAEIILDEEQGIDEAKKAIDVFKAHKQKNKAVFDRMRKTQALLACTGKQPKIH